VGIQSGPEVTSWAVDWLATNSSACSCFFEPRVVPESLLLALNQCVNLLPCRMRLSGKFVLCTGALSAAAFCAFWFVSSTVTAKISHLGRWFLLASILCWIVPAASSYLASKRSWIPDHLTLVRCVVGTLPLICMPLAFVVSLIGWGDPQEHVIRAFLHEIHRVLPEPMVGRLVLRFGISLTALLATTAAWLAVSILTRRFRVRTLLVFSLCMLLITNLLLLDLSMSLYTAKGWPICGLLLTFFLGSLFSIAVSANHTRLGIATLLSTGGVFAILFVAGCIFLFRKSSPEKRLPESAATAVWSLDLTKAGCPPSWWGGPTPYSAPNQIAFADARTIGMVFPTSQPSKGGGFEYTTCVLSIDAERGTGIAHKEVKYMDPSISGRADGSFVVAARDRWTTFSRGLEELKSSNGVGTLDSGRTQEDIRLSEELRHFRLDQDQTLWFEDQGSRRALSHGSCDGSWPHALNENRFFFAACTKFMVFDGLGNLVAQEDFVRPKVNFAAVSRNRRRFAVAVYVWGFGDPSYLEEESIVIYDVSSLQPIFGVRSSPLPKLQSWTALSPDGSLVAIGAEQTLRLFRLPPE